LRLAHLFDHLVGAGKQRGRNVQTERLRRPHVHHELEFRRLLDRNVTRLDACMTIFFTWLAARR
jgi:hypothetical protein